MKISTMHLINKTISECNCSCHTSPGYEMHFMPCCDFSSYKKVEIPTCNICKTEFIDNDDDHGGDCKKCVESC